MFTIQLPASPYGPVKRVKWSPAEREVMMVCFQQNITNEKLPSLTQIQEIIKLHPVLKYRTPPQVKSWINNQYKHKK